MAVATMRRSAGSPWNSDKRELAMQMAGESGSSSAGRFRFADIQETEKQTAYGLAAEQKECMLVAIR